jgi:predicted phage baseplate assembly protein
MIASSRWGDLVVTGDARRRALAERDGNGLDGVEVRSAGTGLIVYFIDRAPRGLEPGNVRIVAPPGGRTVGVEGVWRASEGDPELEDHLIVELDRSGSAGRYRLMLVEQRPDGSPGHIPLRGIDPRFASVSFRFDVGGPRPPMTGSAEGSPAVDETVSYLARDYAGLRQLMLDRLAVTMPQWTEQHEPDVLVTLVELLAYIGDDLSYYEDAVATEAYLQTARNRISVRRHARLLNYRLSEGCSARAWVCLQVSAPLALALGSVRFAIAGNLVDGGSPVLEPPATTVSELSALPQYSPLATAPGSAASADTIELLPAHNAIQLWSWGERDSHLVTGATSAVLEDGNGERGRTLRLRPGDVLVFEQSKDPATLGVAPGDPGLRQAVRLSEVQPRWDPLYEQPLVEVRWAPEDALAFELAVTAGGNPCAVASGNAILVAHGVPASETVTVSAPALSAAGLSWSVPFPDPAIVARHQARMLRGLYAAWRREVSEWLLEAVVGIPLSEERRTTLAGQLGERRLELIDLLAIDPELDDPARAELEAVALAELLARADLWLAPRRERLRSLAQTASAGGPLEDVLIRELELDWGRELIGPLLAGNPGSWGPAGAATTQDPRAALPLLVLESEASEDLAQAWTPAPDLLNAGPEDRRLVAEIDDQGLAQLRLSGAPAGDTLSASYRLGNGAVGNAEVEAINALVWVPPAEARAAAPTVVTGVRNPLAVAGGIDPETTAAAKLAIPGAFRDAQPRALSADDYSSLAAAVTGVRRAAAQLRFSGARTVVEVAIQPAVGEDPGEELLHDVWHALEPARRIGHLVDVVAPRYRALVVELTVSLRPSAIRAQIARRLARLLSSGWTPDGQPGLFNPSRLAFATPVYSSPIVAAVQDLDDVTEVVLERFGLLEPAATAVASAITPGTLEIVRLDNDPTAPEHGYATVHIEGGR